MGRCNSLCCLGICSSNAPSKSGFKIPNLVRSESQIVPPWSENLRSRKRDLRLYPQCQNLGEISGAAQKNRPPCLCQTDVRKGSVDSFVRLSPSSLVRALQLSCVECAADSAVPLRSIVAKVGLPVLPHPLLRQQNNPFREPPRNYMWEQKPPPASEKHKFTLSTNASSLRDWGSMSVL